MSTFIVTRHDNHIVEGSVDGVGVTITYNAAELVGMNAAAVIAFLQARMVAEVVASQAKTTFGPGVYTT